MTVGVFDSGVGGLSVANRIKAELPEVNIVLKMDQDNLPYGTKSPETLYTLLRPIISSMIEQDGCDVIVIACNTVSTTLKDQLRDEFNIPFVIVEPMVKPASLLTKTNVIAVCATPTTLSSKRYSELKQLYAKDLEVIEPDCHDWAGMIEANNFSKTKLDSTITAVLNQGADVIVLACTHYHWIEDDIVKLASGRAVVINPEMALVAQLKRVIEQRL